MTTPKTNTPTPPHGGELRDDLRKSVRHKMCPWCCGNPKPVGTVAGWHIECKSCGACRGSVYANLEIAWDSWDSRAQPDKQPLLAETGKPKVEPKMEKGEFKREGSERTFKSICAFCEREDDFPDSKTRAAQMAEHVITCKKHPIQMMLGQMARLEEAGDDMEQMLYNTQGSGNQWRVNRNLAIAKWNQMKGTK